PADAISARATPRSSPRSTACSTSSSRPSPRRRAIGRSRSCSTGRSARPRRSRSPACSRRSCRHGAGASYGNVRMLDDFHFLRPAWLLALPLGVALILYAFRTQASGGAWRRVVDRALQPLVLTAADRFTGRRWPLLAALAAWTLATIALAGPAWERLPVPAFRSNEALVVALDLSRSMDAADLSPSRIARAKLKLLSLLDRRDGGQTGL